MTSLGDPRAERGQGDYWYEGEVISLPERIVVAQVRGHVHPEPLEAGARIHRGDLVVRLIGGDEDIDVRAPVAGTIATWFIRAGDAVAKGDPLLSIRRLVRR